MLWYTAATWEGLARHTKSNHLKSFAEDWNHLRNSVEHPVPVEAVRVIGGNLCTSFAAALQVANGMDDINVHEAEGNYLFSQNAQPITDDLQYTSSTKVVACMLQTDAGLLPAPSPITAGQQAGEPPERKRKASSAAQPAVPKANTPLLDKLLGVLASDDTNDGMHIIDDIVRTYMFDKLKPTEVQESFEACLQACEAARQQKLQQLWDAWDERACQGWEQLANIELSDNDMKDVMNTWLHSPEKWMNPWNLAQLPFM